MRKIPKVICHHCFGKGVIPEEGYADCPYCENGFEDDPDYLYDDEMDCDGLSDYDPE